MVVIKQAKRNKSGKKDKFKDDPLIQMMKKLGYEFDNEGRMITNPNSQYNWRKEENEK